MSPNLREILEVTIRDRESGGWSFKANWRDEIPALESAMKDAAGEGRSAMFDVVSAKLQEWEIPPTLLHRLKARTRHRAWGWRCRWRRFLVRRSHA